MSATLLDSPREVLRFCQALQGAPALAVDTEFMRERTYRAVLALVQIAAPDGSVGLIDTLAVAGDAWEPLQELLLDQTITKVLHASAGDVEVLEQRLGAVPTPIWDTQLVSGLLGYSGQIGYGGLVEDMMGVRLSKQKTLTDWTKRPLSPEQLEYAANDVRYLLPIYERQREELQKSGRLTWAEAECRVLEKELASDISARADAAVYRTVKGWHRLDRRGLAILRELAAWRENEAIRRNLPRPWILRDDLLIQLARAAPVTMAQLRENRVELKDGQRAGNDLLAAIARGKRVPDAECPEPCAFQRPLDEDESALASLLSAVLKTVCRKHGVSPSLVATRDELEGLIRTHGNGNGSAHPVLNGWRGELVGADLVAILEGHRKVGWNPREKLIEIRD